MPRKYQIKIDCVRLEQSIIPKFVSGVEVHTLQSKEFELPDNAESINILNIYSVDISNPTEIGKQKITMCEVAYLVPFNIDVK